MSSRLACPSLGGGGAALFLARALALAAAVLVLPASNCSEDVGEGDSVGISTVRVSVLPQDAEAGDSSNHASISADGRFVAFSSAASNLTPGDANGFRDIFVKDRLTGAVENLTNVTSILLTPADCDYPSISGDGRFVAFQSTGDYVDDPNWPLGNTTVLFVYVFDRVQRVFRAPTLWPTPWPNDATTFPTLSYDGRYLAFASAATNLPGVTTAAMIAQAIRCDFGPDYSTRTLVVASQAEGMAAGTGANGVSAVPSISGDGSRIAFSSGATDLASAQDSHPGLDVYLWTAPSTVTLASVQNPSSAQYQNVWGALSQDGNWIVYRHQDTAIGNPTPRSIRRFDVVSGTTQMVSDPGHGIGTFDRPSLSGDGRVVGYCGFVPGPSPVAQIYLYVEGAGAVTQASVSSFGVSGTQNSVNVSVAADGRWVAWESATAELVDGDTNGASDIFVRGPLR